MYGPGMYFNEDEYLLYIGRLATTSGLIGMLVGLITSLILGFGTIGIILMILFFGYLFLTGFWGGYKLNHWFRRFRYRLPTPVWMTARVFVVLVGIVAGTLVWGFFEHFILLLAMGGTGDPGLIGSQVILLPKIGRKYATYIKYSPSQVK